MPTKPTLIAVLAMTLVALVFTPLAVADTTDRPSNGRITFGRFDPDLGDFSIWAANPDGTHQKRLTHVPSFTSDWSPNGRRIAFTYADDAGVQVATMDPDGRDVHELTLGGGIHEDPKWSPDGKRITFGASPLLPWEPGFFTSVWIMRADGSRVRQLTNDGFDVEPVFSPDGSQIAFGRITGINADGIQDEAIYVINADGTELPGGRAPAPRTRTSRLVTRRSLDHLQHLPGVTRSARYGLGDRRPSRTAAASGYSVPPRSVTCSPRQCGRRTEASCSWCAATTSRRVDKICVMDANGRNVEVAINTSSEPVNFPAWGSRPPSH